MGTPARNLQIVRFADYVLDLETAELRRNGTKVILQEQPFQILTTLIESQGRLVAREELIKKLWPNGTFVDYEQSLNKAVARLREALGDHAEDPQFVETFPRKGYRFVAPIQRSMDQTTLAVVSQRKEEEAGGCPNPQLVEAQPRATSASRIVKPFTIALSILVFVFVVWTVLARFNASRVSSSTTPFRSLAVLPLENLSGDAEQDYFADGMTDELITKLAQVSSVRVISRTSVMQYRGVHKPLPQIARELNVDAVVEGTVVRWGNQVRITAQLIQAASDRHLWAESYQGDVKDVLGLQNEIARAVAKEIRSTLIPRKEIHEGVARPANLAAYESYWRGEYFLDKLTPESVKKAADYFQDAVVKEPDYVAAYNKLAAAYQILGNMGALSKSESRSKSALAIDKALAADPLSGPAHAAKGWGALLNDLDFTTAEAEFKRAVELSPNEVQGHQGLADYYAAVGQVDQAVLEMERARQVDPLSFIVNVGVCRILYFARRFDEALAQCKVNLNFNPKSQRTLWNIKAIYQAKGSDADAATVFLQAAEASGAPLDVIATLKKAQHESGLREMCKASLLRPNQSDERREDLLTWASIYSCAGNKDKALVLLKRAINERSFGIVWLGVDPTYDDLRSDPRFVSLLRRIGLPESQPRN